MNCFFAALLALSAARPALADHPELAPPQGPSVDGRASSGETMVMDTGSGQIRWKPGSAEWELLSRQGTVLHSFPLARPDRRPPKGATYRALLPPRGHQFLVVEETRREVGLHLSERLADAKPKAAVVRSVLRLVDESSRIFWERTTEDKTQAGTRADPQHLQIAPNGTTAILLEDVDPYTKNRPVLSVISPGGREVLKLDYTAFQRVDEFALAPDGRALVVHGFGLVPEEGTAGRAIGYYQPGKGALWIKQVPRMADPRLRLELVSADGWTCYVETPDGWTAYSRSGEASVLSAEEMWRKFAVRP